MNFDQVETEKIKDLPQGTPVWYRSSARIADNDAIGPLFVSSEGLVNSSGVCFGFEYLSDLAPLCSLWYTMTKDQALVMPEITYRASKK